MGTMKQLAKDIAKLHLTHGNLDNVQKMTIPCGNMEARYQVWLSMGNIMYTYSSDVYLIKRDAEKIANWYKSLPYVRNKNVRIVEVIPRSLKDMLEYNDIFYDLVGDFDKLPAHVLSWYTKTADIRYTIWSNNWFPDMTEDLYRMLKKFGRLKKFGEGQISTTHIEIAKSLYDAPDSRKYRFVIDDCCTYVEYRL